MLKSEIYKKAQLAVMKSDLSQSEKNEIIKTLMGEETLARLCEEPKKAE